MRVIKVIEFSGIKCNECGNSISQSQLNFTNEMDCPKCRSSSRSVQLHITEEIVAYDCLKAKVRNPNFNSKKNPRHELIEGYEVQQSDGKWMKKTRIIDKNNDHYLEIVKVPKTEEVIHYSNELLSQHFGHGSAKPKKIKD